jgi:ABC-type dipeptide/oligopeptide/nickel transport system ATPase subunit
MISCLILLEVCGLYKSYPRGRLARESQLVLNGVDLSLQGGARLALVGESASGKSTLARCIAAWETPSRGEVKLASNARVQLIPQNAGDSLNPRFASAQIIAEPLRIRGAEPAPSHSQALVWMDRVRLPRSRERDRPRDFSGGERVRLAIARALAATVTGGPALLIFDESFSSLDVPLQQQLLDLLSDLQAQFPLTYLLIAHDLILSARFADEIAVMHAGRIVERGPAGEVVRTPRSDPARALVAAMQGAAS